MAHTSITSIGGDFQERTVSVGFIQPGPNTFDESVRDIDLGVSQRIWTSLRIKDIIGNFSKTFDYINELPCRRHAAWQKDHLPGVIDVDVT